VVGNDLPALIGDDSEGSCSGMVTEAVPGCVTPLFFLQRGSYHRLSARTRAAGAGIDVARELLASARIAIVMTMGHAAAFVFKIAERPVLFASSCRIGPGDNDTICITGRNNEI
jgi:hypothetical protein